MPQVDPRAVVELLCEEMTEVARAEKLGIARSSYYKWITKLTEAEVIISQGQLLPGMAISAAHPRSSRSGTHHAPVIHVWWADEDNQWDVQGALLDAWDISSSKSPDTVIAIRWVTRDEKAHKHSYVVSPRSQWTTKDTATNLSTWWLPNKWVTIKNLTVAVARVLEVKAIIVPENH